MEILKDKDIEQVSGGLIPQVLAGIAGAYLYDTVGGKEGIDNYLANAWASTKSSISYWSRRIR
jgi:lactobin A/cerein 7B family class IIb bacteriocin